jgi:ABC-type transporter Mla MlaB component
VRFWIHRIGLNQNVSLSLDSFKAQKSFIRAGSVLRFEDTRWRRDISWPRWVVATSRVSAQPPTVASCVFAVFCGLPGIGTARALTVAMLKISTVDTESGTKELQLSGSISGAWVQELQNCCEAWLAAGNAVTLDLKDVEFADASGLELISTLRARNVLVVRWTPLVSRLLAAHEARNAEFKSAVEETQC